MAFVDPNQDPENQQQNNPSQSDQALNPNQQSNSAQPVQAPQAPTTGGGGAANAGAPTGGPSGTAGAGAPATQASGTAVTGNTQATPAQQNANSGWTNLNQYLNANQDQATQMGQQIASTVNQSGNQAQSDINNLGTNFQNSVNQNTVQSNPNAVNQAVTDAENLGAGGTLSSADQSAYNSQANASYSGPNDVTSYSGYNQALGDVNNAEQEAQETGTEAGRGSLLNQQYQNSSQYGYNQGENNLDQLLLQNSTGAQAALQPLQSQWSGLNSALNNTVTTGDQEAASANATDQATAAAAQNILGNATSNFENNLNTGLTNLQTTDQGEYNQLMSDIQSGNLSSSDYQALGMNPQLDHNYLPTNSLGTYVTQGAQPTLATYATPAQYAQAAALAELAGQQTSPFLTPSTISQAGTAETTPALSVNSKQLQGDEGTAQAEYNQAIADQLANINSGMVGAVNPAGYGSVSNIPPSYSSIQDAMSGLSQMLNNSQYSGIPGFADWAKSQFNNVNQVQNAYNFPGFGWVQNVNTRPVMG